MPTRHMLPSFGVAKLKQAIAQTWLHACSQLSPRLFNRFRYNVLCHVDQPRRILKLTNYKRITPSINKKIRKSIKPLYTRIGFTCRSKQRFKKLQVLTSRSVAHHPHHHVSTKTKSRYGINKCPNLFFRHFPKPAFAARTLTRCAADANHINTNSPHSRHISSN